MVKTCKNAITSMNLSFEAVIHSSLKACFKSIGFVSRKSRNTAFEMSWMT